MLGYDWNDGGINNQKLALLGLFIEGWKHKTPIYLPKIHSKDQHDKRSEEFPLGDIFWLGPIVDFADRWGIVIADTPKETKYVDRIDRCGWNFFGAGTGHLASVHHKGNLALDISADFFRALRPKVTSTQLFSSLCHQVFSAKDIKTVVQLRIEEDWFNYCECTLKPTVKGAEDYYLAAEKIIMKVKNTIPVDSGALFVSCDEAYIFAPKWEISDTVRRETGIDIVWKSDLLPLDDFSKMPPIHASLMDFEIAKLAETFVGLTRSTFANLACFERYANAYRDRRADYVYNLPGPMLGRRVDFGLCPEPDAACGLA